MREWMKTVEVSAYLDIGETHIKNMRKEFLGYGIYTKRAEGKYNGHQILWRSSDIKNVRRIREACRCTTLQAFRVQAAINRGDFRKVRT